MMMMGATSSVVETSIAHFTLRELSEEECAEYRRPYLTPGEGRRPLLSWARQQVDGEPADVGDIISAYTAWLGATNMPKLLINAEPGGLLTGERLALARSWPNQSEVTVKGLHNIQENSPDEIGQAISAWYNELTPS